jgi:hypothetical protein
MRQHFLEGERESMQVEEVDAADISACFAYLRRIPGKQGKPPSERTIERLFEKCSKYIDILALEANLSDFSNSL